MIPPSFLSGSSLKRESIISDLGDCVLTDALYFEIRGQHLDPTTYKFQQTEAKIVTWGIWVLATEHPTKTNQRHLD